MQHTSHKRVTASLLVARFRIHGSRANRSSANESSACAWRSKARWVGARLSDVDKLSIEVMSRSLLRHKSFPTDENRWVSTAPASAAGIASGASAPKEPSVVYLPARPAICPISEGS